MALVGAAGLSPLVPATPLLQLPQRDTEADAVTAADVAVDDDGGERGFVEAGVVFQLGVKLFVNFDVRCAQLVEGIDEASFGVLAYLRCQVAWIEQHELGAV